MAVSQVDICNAANGRLGQDVAIAAMSEQSKAARAYNRVWERVRDYVLADFPWPFALKSVALSPVSQTALGWQYGYAYPADCLNALIVCDSTGVRSALTWLNDGNEAQTWDSRYDFEIQNGTQSTLIVSDLSGAYLIYSSRVEDVGRYPPMFIDALVNRLAIEVAPVLAAEVGIRLGPALEQKYIAAKGKAIVQSLNESLDRVQPMTPALAARGG